MFFLFTKNKIRHYYSYLAQYFILLFGAIIYSSWAYTNLQKISFQELNCLNSLKLGFKGKVNPRIIKSFCTKSKVLSSCVLSNNHEVFHLDLKNSTSSTQQKVLVFSAFHGDEPESLEFALNWLQTLKINPSESSLKTYWRFVPLVNPIGLKNKSRVNGNKVDINRNFPTKDWQKQALSYWKKVEKKKPRRFPGFSGGSERETQCVISHLEDFKPDIVVAVHTPYGILDYDGPPINFPKFSSLPWRRLGTKTGSLGRYLWDDRRIPIMTIELPYRRWGYRKMLQLFRFADLVIDRTIKHLKK